MESKSCSARSLCHGAFPIWYRGYDRQDQLHQTSGRFCRTVDPSASLMRISCARRSSVLVPSRNQWCRAGARLEQIPSSQETLNTQRPHRKRASFVNVEAASSPRRTCPAREFSLPTHRPPPETASLHLQSAQRSLTRGKSEPTSADRTGTDTDSRA